MISGTVKTSFCDSDPTSCCACVNLHTYMFFITHNRSKPINYKPHKVLWLRPGAFYLVWNLKAAKCDKLAMSTALPDERQGFEALNVIYTLIKVMDCVIDYFQDPSAFHPVPERPIIFPFVTATENLMVLCGDGDPPRTNSRPHFILFLGA